MSIEETIGQEKDMLDALQFALNAFVLATNVQPGDDGEMKPAKIKNLRVETVERPSKRVEENNWRFVISYQEDVATNSDTSQQDDFLDRFSRNRRYFKQIVVSSNPLRVESISNVD